MVFWGYSNKGHDGFLGNAVLGQWCNIGADTNASNLKNTYDEVKVWNYASGRFDRSGQQFCGLIMGDHSKCGINTMFNTGTVVGVGCNLYGAGFPRQFVPDFSWGGAQGFVTHKLDAVHKTASLVMPRRKRTYGDFEKASWRQFLRLLSASRRRLIRTFKNIPNSTIPIPAYCNHWYCSSNRNTPKPAPQMMPA